MLVFDASALLDSAHPDHPQWMVAVHDAWRRMDCHAPALIASEVGQVVHNKRAMQFGPTPELRSSAAELLLAQVGLVPSDPAMRALAGELCVLGLSFYDAEYVALAQRLDAILVTHDQAMAKVARVALGKARVVDLDGLRQLVKARPAA
ncbi:MAG: type II toxin-antitoxin system VapC family toxin [Candidatus Thermoplasmatota archaeon]